MDFQSILSAAAGEHGIAVNPWAAIAYLVAGVLFILSLRGLSSPATAQSGNRFGMMGMTIAVVTTLVTHVPWKTGDGTRTPKACRRTMFSCSRLTVGCRNGGFALK